MQPRVPHPPTVGPERTYLSGGAGGPGEVRIAAGPPSGLAGAPAPGPPWSSALRGLTLGFLRRPDFSSLAATGAAPANPEAAALEAACARTPDHVALGDHPRRGGAGPQVPGGATRGAREGLVFAVNWGKWTGMVLSLCSCVSFISLGTPKLTLRSQMCDD